MATGQANVKSYNRELCALISSGKARPSMIISNELGLEEAAEGYKHFDAREKGWTKVVLKPGKNSGARKHTQAKSASAV
jgi:glutathione-independent formaldehyde dehydrogenase